MRRIKKGENSLFYRFLKKEDKTAFNRSEFTTFVLDLIQNGLVIQSYTFPSSYLRAGTALNEIEIEVATSVSDQFTAGKVVAKYTFTIPNAELVDSTFKVILTEEILDVENLP